MLTFLSYRKTKKMISKTNLKNDSAPESARKENNQNLEQSAKICKTLTYQQIRTFPVDDPEILQARKHLEKSLPATKTMVLIEIDRG